MTAIKGISLAAARVNAGFTQEEVAARLHRGRQTILSWEKGYSAITAEDLTKLCELYRVPMDFIILPTESTAS